MLTSADETDLLLPLHDATLGEARFPTFLDRLRQRGRAAHAGLLIRGEGRNEERFHAGLDLIGEAAARGFARTTVTERLPFEDMRPNRVYSSGEFIDTGGPGRDRYLAHLGAIGIVDERIVRVAVGESGLTGWLVLARGAPSPSSDSALLSALSPHLAVAVRNHAAEQQARLAASVADAGLARAATGSLAFDREARLLSITPFASAWIRRASGRQPQLGQRLTGLGAEVQRRLQAAAAHFATTRGGADESLSLSRDPRIDAVLTAGRPLAGGAPEPAMIALCRFPAASSTGRARALAALHDLPPREAELAVRISEGSSLVEAGEAMGLTVETTRNYSKQLYGRLGVRGQTELVALVCGSGAMLG